MKLKRSEEVLTADDADEDDGISGRFTGLFNSSASSAVDSSSIRPPFPIGFVRGTVSRPGCQWFRNSAHHNGPMGSFGKPIRGRSRPFMRPILPSLPMGSFGKAVTGFVRGKPIAQGIDIFRNSAHHNGPMGSFGKPIRGRSGPFSRRILPRQPLASFRNTVVGFVRGIPSMRLKRSEEALTADDADNRR
jgi:hypothetical protein